MWATGQRQKQIPFGDDNDGKLRKFINIYINDEDIRFLGGEDYVFKDGDEVMLIPSIAGGTT